MQKKNNLKRYYTNSIPKKERTRFGCSHIFFINFIKKEILNNPKIKVISNQTMSRLITQNDKIVGIEFDDSSSLFCDFVTIATGPTFSLQNWLNSSRNPQTKQSTFKNKEQTTFYSVLTEHNKINWPNENAIFSSFTMLNHKVKITYLPYEGNKASIIISLPVGIHNELSKNNKLEHTFLKLLKSDKKEYLKDFNEQDFISHPVRVDYFRHSQMNEFNFLPQNLLIVGDSLATWNPQMGFSMTMTLNQAEIISRSLEAKDYDFYSLQLGLQVLVKNSWPLIYNLQDTGFYLDL